MGRVIVQQPLNEDGQTYQPGASFETSPERASRLEGLGLVVKAPEGEESRIESGDEGTHEPKSGESDRAPVNDNGAGQLGLEQAAQRKGKKQPWVK